MMVRAARPGDGAAIGSVVVRSWQAAYRGIFPDALLDGLDPVERGRWWERRVVTLDDSRAAVLVAERGGVVVGFAAVGPSLELEPELGAVYTLYVAPEAWDLGVGRALFAEAHVVLAALGYRAATLWVAEANARARRFYEAAGWAFDGGVQHDDSFGAPIVEVRYRSPEGGFASPA